MALEEQEILRVIGNLDPRTGYTARVRAFNRFGTPSDWSEAISFNTGDINIPGAIPTVYLAAGARMILAQWSAITNTGFDHYEIYVNTTANFTPDSNHLVASPEAGTIYQITKYWNGSASVDLLVGKTYYVQVYWVDGSNNKTLMGTEVSATTGISVNEDGIQSSTIVADRIATGTLLASYTLSGTIKTGDTGARMELDSGGFRGYGIDGVTKTIEYKTSDGSLTVVGSISGGTIDIGGADSTSFHVDINGNMWLGAAVFAGAPFSVTSTGSMVVSNATFTGGSVSGSGVSGTTVSGTNTVANSSGNTLQSGNFVAGTSGWVIKGNGDVEFNAGTFRGALAAATGTFAGSLSAATGTFAGSLSAAGGTFTGSLSAATGTFAGSLSAATGTFSGSLSAASGTFTGTLSAGSLSGNINNSSGTIIGGTFQTSSSYPRVVISTYSSSVTGDYVKFYVTSDGSDFLPGEITSGRNIGAGDLGTIALVVPQPTSSHVSGSVLISTNTSGSTISLSSTGVSVPGVITVSSTATFNGGINIASTTSLSMNGNTTINSSRQFVGSGGISTAGSISGATYSVAGSSAINSFVQFVGVGGVNTSGSISTSSSGSFGAGISVSGGTAFLNSSCSISGVLSTSSSATSATLFVTSMPTLSAFTVGLASGNQIAVQSSSEKIKRDIASLTNEHNTSNLYQLEARSFNMKGADRIRPDDADKWVGLVVEEVERIDPTLVMIDKEHDYADIDWRALSTYMLVEMQKMRKEIDTINKSK